MRIEGLVAAVAVLVGCEPVVEPGGGAASSQPAAPRVVDAPALWGAPVAPLGDGRVAIPDAEGDAVYLVQGGSRSRLQFPLGSRPARVVAAGRDLGVVLRGTGQLARVERPAGNDTIAAETLINACTEPRGIAYDAATDALVVACATGELITVSGDSRTEVDTGLELRDVMVVGGKRWATTFRSAQLVALDAQGKVEVQLAPPHLPIAQVTFAPHVAWRAVSDGSRIVMVHQLEVVDEVTKLTNPGPTAPYYGAPFCTASVVSSALTVFDTETKTVVWSRPIIGSVPIDVASEGGRAAVAFAGPRRAVEFELSGLPAGGGCLVPATGPEPKGMPVGVGYLGGELLVFEHSGELRRHDRVGHQTTDVALGRLRQLDEGRELFHAQSPSGVACASCHPEGFDDGHTWNFGGSLLRSQSLEGGLLATAPYHWDGSLQTVHDVLDETFVLRMGGLRPDVSQVRAIEGWLDRLPARPAGTYDRAAAKRGAYVFAKAECGTCHSGEGLTNATTVDVGTGQPYQVPSLKALRWRGPWMHDGCAATLEQRFEPSCGGAKHGKPVAPEDVGDLVEYLKTL